MEIILKQNDSLKLVADALGMSEEKTTKAILSNLKDAGLEPDVDMAGLSLLDVFSQDNRGRNEMMSSIFQNKMDDIEIDGCADGLILWGTHLENGCPECGFELEITPESLDGHDWNDEACSFCEYESSNEPDWDCLPGGKDY